MARERWTDMDEETTVPGKAPRGIETKKGSVMASVVSRMPSLRSGLGDCLGGLAAMLVALPSAIAFGLIVYAPLGSEHAGKAAVAGVTGTIALGLVAPAFGGTSRLISAPCAPGAAVLAVFVGELVRNRSIQPETIPLYVALVALLAGLLQFVAGSLGGGKFIKYIPYPVVAGYLNGLGILILAGQLPKFFGLPKDVSLFSGLVSPEYWQWPCIAVGTATVFAMLLAPRITKTIPAAILALVAGIACYALLARAMPPLASLQGNTFVIGPIAMTGAGFVNAAAHQWAQIGQIGFDGLGLVVVPVFTLAILLSIDTLKTCVILDAMTYSRHNSNRELVGQGLGNMASALACGIPGAGTLGPTLVNVNSGAQTSLSGLFAGLSALAVLLLIGQLIAWIPLAALAGILIVVAYRMLDWSSFRLLKHHSTVFDFFVILSVVVSAVSMSLIAAAGVGIAMAILLFLREQVRFPVVRRKAFGNQIFSKKKRRPTDLRVLESEGMKSVVFELQGQLFFGTADQLFSEMEPHLSKSKYILLDMRRVRSVDFTAANMLRQIHARIRAGGGRLLFSSVPQTLPTGQNVKDYLGYLGLSESLEDVMFFPELDDALEWMEDAVLSNARAGTLFGMGEILDMSGIEFFAGLSAEAMADLRACVTERTHEPGDHIFSRGDRGDEILFIRQGTVKILLPLPDGMTHHLATFGAGDFFGDMSFLDRCERSANAIAVNRVSLYVLSRQVFDEVSLHHPVTTRKFFERLSHAISMRLRQTNAELMALEQS